MTSYDTINYQVSVVKDTLDLFCSSISKNQPLNCIMDVEDVLEVLNSSLLLQLKRDTQTLTALCERLLADDALDKVKRF